MLKINYLSRYIFMKKDKIMLVMITIQFAKLIVLIEIFIDMKGTLYRKSRKKTVQLFSKKKKCPNLIKDTIYESFYLSRKLLVKKTMTFLWQVDSFSVDEKKCGIFWNWISFFKCLVWNQRKRKSLVGYSSSQKFSQSLLGFNCLS